MLKFSNEYQNHRLSRVSDSSSIPHSISDKKMAEESDARIERLEKAHQNHQRQMAEMIELLRTLVREKGQASSLSTQNETAQHDQRKEEPVYPVGFTPPYASNVHMAQGPPMQQAGSFQYGYAPPLVRVNETRQNSGRNADNPIEIPNLDDPTVIEKIRKESMEQSESNEAQRKLELIEERLKVVEGYDVYGLVDTYKMSLVSDLVLPPKFKVPTFDKYDGTKCPSAHLYMYYRKMTGHTTCITER